MRFLLLSLLLTGCTHGTSRQFADSAPLAVTPRVSAVPTPPMTAARITGVIRSLHDHHQLSVADTDCAAWLMTLGIFEGLPCGVWFARWPSAYSTNIVECRNPMTGER